MSKGLYVNLPEEFEFGDLLKLVQDGVQSGFPKKAKGRISFDVEDGFNIYLFPDQSDAQSAFSNKVREQEKPKKKSPPKKRASKKKSEPKGEDAKAE